MFFWIFCSKAFVSLLIPAEVYFSTLYTCSICTARGSLCEYSTQHLSIFKKRSATDRLIFSGGTTTPQLSCINSSREGIDEHVRYAFLLEQRPFQVCNFQYESAQQKLTVGGPPLVTTWIFFLPFSLSVVSSSWHLNFFLRHTHTQILPFLCRAPKYNGSVRPT